MSTLWILLASWILGEWLLVGIVYYALKAFRVPPKGTPE